MSDAITLVEDLDLVVSLAAGHVHPDDLRQARDTAAGARMRAGHLGTTMVLALVGGTGSGKSSLVNALVGAHVASTSPIRPHTTEPLAVVPGRPDAGLQALLDRLGVTRAVTQDRFPAFAFLDMTDIDSVARDHRARVERLLPDVDAVLWVMDPVKYADPGLHRDFVAPLARSADRFVFVLNKVDRLEDGHVDRVVEHLRRLLVDDGIPEPAICATAAAPPGARPIGMEELAAELAARFEEKRVHIGKIVDDARRATQAVSTAAGITRRGSLEFERRWDEVRAAVAAEVTRAAGPAAFEEALRLIEGLVAGLSADAGGPFGMRLRQSFSTRLVETELGAAFRAAAAAPDRGGAIDRELQERFGAPLRALLWERASLSAVVAGLAVDASQVDEILGRGTGA